VLYCKIAPLNLENQLNCFHNMWDHLKFLKKKGIDCYHLALPSSLDHMHDFFHVYVLCHYILYPYHVTEFIHLQMLGKGASRAKPICILDRCT
jgi:hypothetical protein